MTDGDNISDFGRSSSLLAAAIAASTPIIEETFGSWTEAAEKLFGGLDQFTRFFSTSKILIDLALLANSLENATVNLSRTFGSSRAESSKLARDMQEVSKQTSLFGKGISEVSEIFIALKKELRTTVSQDLLTTAAKISQIFTMSDEKAGLLTASLARWGRIDAPKIEEIMGSIGVISKEWGLDIGDVADSLHSDIEYLSRIGTLTNKNSEGFAKQVVLTHALGLNLANAVSLADQMITPTGAAEMAAKLSMLGVRVNPMAMFAQAYSGDSMGLQKNLYQSALGSVNRFGGLDSVGGKNQARLLAPVFITTFEKMMESLRRLEDINKNPPKPESTHAQWMKEMLAASRSSNKTLDDTFKALVETIGSPLIYLLNSINFIMRQLNASVGFFLTQIRSITKTVFGGNKTAAGLSEGIGSAAITTLGLYAAPRLIRAGHRAVDGGITKLLSKVSERFRNRGISGDDIGNLREPGSSPSSRPDRSGGVPSGAGDSIGSARSLTAPQMIARMGGAALVMVAFAGAVWILSKAFQNFGKVEWNKVKDGTKTLLTVVSGLAALVGIMGVVAGTGAGAIVMAAGIAVLALLTITLSELSKTFLNFGNGIKAGAEGFEILKGLDMKSIRGSLNVIGEWADLYDSSLDSASRSIERIAKAIGKLSENISNLDISKTKELFSAMNQMPSLAGVSGSKSNPVDLYADITLQIDAEVLLRATKKLTAGPK
jgi:hypothetical protein